MSSRFPDFIGIGAARSGTTWVARQLAQHSDIWLPRIKELHYFSRSLKYDGPSYLNDSSLVKRVFSSEEHFQKYRYHLYRAIGSNLIRPSLDKLRWDCLYFFGQPSDDWYASLFATADNRIAGEITPQYSVLQVDDIRAIIESSAYKPVSSKFKVFIIDEIHMLSNSAFNALLKILVTLYNETYLLPKNHDNPKVLCKLYPTLNWPLDH